MGFHIVDRHGDVREMMTFYFRKATREGTARIIGLWKPRTRSECQFITNVPIPGTGESNESAKGIAVTLKGFNLQSGILATIAGKPPKSLSIDEALNQVSIESESDIAPGSGVVINSVDGQLTATATLS